MYLLSKRKKLKDKNPLLENFQTFINSIMRQSKFYTPFQLRLAIHHSNSVGWVYGSATSFISALPKFE